MKAKQEYCYLCGVAGGTTREHIVKASDFRRSLPNVSPKSPAHFVQLANGNSLKRSTIPSARSKNSLQYFKGKICENCNTKISAPYDKAWEHFANFMVLRNVPLKVGDQLIAQKVFGPRTREGMVHLHLYFVKHMLGVLQERDEDRDRAALSASFVNGAPYEHLSLKFGVCGVHGVAAMDAVVTREKFGTTYQFADRLAVQLLLKAPNAGIEFRGCWNPLQKGRHLKMYDFR